MTSDQVPLLESEELAIPPDVAPSNIPQAFIFRGKALSTTAAVLPRTRYLESVLKALQHTSKSSLVLLSIDLNLSITEQQKLRLANPPNGHRTERLFALLGGFCSLQHVDLSGCYVSDPAFIVTLVTALQKPLLSLGVAIAPADASVTSILGLRQLKALANETADTIQLMCPELQVWFSLLRLAYCNKIKHQAGTQILDPEQVSRIGMETSRIDRYRLRNAHSGLSTTFRAK